MNCLCRIPSYAAVVLRSQALSFLAPAFPPSGPYTIPSTGSASPSSRTLRPSKPKTAEEKPAALDREKGVFYVARKGDILGVYRSFSDCQAQFGSSIRDPPVSILKGHGMPTDSEDHILSRGLKNAIYTMDAADLKDDLFGLLPPCPVVEPASYRVDSSQDDSEGSVETSSVALSCKLELMVHQKEIRAEPVLELYLELMLGPRSVNYGKV
ncbi:hypothetical protein MLD38_002449 [Melastoma candidum]|uniref:Uncharacterized protein n=1 Tax=Melastoma candidum TaxID=119954 RepID=A0ACB9S3R7_9MYRT|nr:hypothetical protein MLD38_002449 [Melastoma candidum]